MKSKNELIAITNEVKLQISDIDIAPPLLYQTLFNNLLSTNELVLEDENLMVDEILEGRLSKLTKLSDSTSRQIVQLEGNTKNAMEAIKSKDDKKLEQILVETASLRKEIEQLKASIFTDTLTKAHNRQWLYANYVDSGEHFTCKGILAFIDMNYFKDINDNYGHIAGDKVLEFTALHLKKTKAELVRYGGDEFLLFFGENLSVDAVNKIMRSNREQLIKKELKYKENSFHTSYSFGVIGFKKGQNFQDVLSNVDELMYADKEDFKHRLITG